jgi:hypothetical protein
MICQEIISRKVNHQRKYKFYEKNRVILGNYTVKSLFWGCIYNSILSFLLTSHVFFANISMPIVNDNGNDSGNVDRNFNGCKNNRCILFIKQ